MSKDLNNNERYLKELANKHQPVPPPMVWDEIEQVLDKDSGKRRSFPFLWLVGILLVGGLVFFNLKGNNGKKSDLAEQKTIINQYEKQNNLNPKDFNTVKSEATNQVVQEVVNQEQRAKVSESIQQDSDNLEPKYEDSNKSKTLLSKQLRLNNSNTTSITTQSNVNRSIHTHTNSINTTVTPINTKTEINKKSRSTQSTVAVMEITEVIRLPTLDWINKPFETGITLQDLSDNLTPLPNSEAKSNSSTSSPWFVELRAGIGSNLSNPVTKDPTQGVFRLNTETRWYSWSTSAQLGYQFDNSWYTTIGFDLNQTKNKFDFWRRDVSSLIVSENQSLQVNSSDFFNIGEIRYTFADVGLSIGKRINIDKWHFSLEGGPIFNVLFNANGKVQVGDLEFSRLEDQEGFFNTQIGIGGRLSAMLDFPISDQLWISAGPTYYQYFNTLSSDMNPIDERNTVLQVKAKVRYHF